MWAGKTNQIARYNAATPGWDYYTAKSGWEMFVVDEARRYRFDGTNWTPAHGVATNNQAGTAYTLAITDAGADVRIANAAANTVTVPSNATVPFPIGAQVVVTQAGAGKTSLAAAGGVTINTPDTLSARKQFSKLRLVKVATDTWDLYGDISLT